MIILIVILIIVVIIALLAYLFLFSQKKEVKEENIKVDIASLTYTKDNSSESIKKYSQD